MTRIDHTNSGILCRVMPGARMLKMVVMKLMAPRIEDAPARCSDKMAKSWLGQACRSSIAAHRGSSRRRHRSNRALRA